MESEETPLPTPKPSHKFRGYRDEIYPPATMDVHIGNLKGFFKFMHSRHRVWRNRFVKKLAREQWCEHDPILAKYKYTNIYRQLDRGTLWCLEFIIKPWKKFAKENKGKESTPEYRDRLKDLIFQLVCYRLCNRIETFEKMGLPSYKNFNPARMLKRLWKISEQHAPMTSAHITLSGSKGYRKMDTLVICMIDCWYRMDEVVDGILNAKSGEDVYLSLRQVRCSGRFIAYEIYCDLCYAKLTKFGINDFVSSGPGSDEGIRMLFPSTKGAKACMEKIHHLRDEADNYFKEYGIKFRYYNKYEPIENQLSLRTIEHSLCEYQKYWLQNKNYGKKRLIYDNVASMCHPYCKVGEGGDTLIVDEKYYADKFYARSDDWSSKQGDTGYAQWLEFRKKYPRKDVKVIRYEVCLKLIDRLKEAYGLVT